MKGIEVVRMYVLKLLQGSIIGTPHRNGFRASYIIDSTDTEGLPVDLWEISPDNVVMDETTFFACGNFGEVYKGYLKTATKSPSESYPAGKTVAVKILQGNCYANVRVYTYMQVYVHRHA